MCLFADGISTHEKGAKRPQRRAWERGTGTPFCASEVKPHAHDVSAQEWLGTPQDTSNYHSKILHVGSPGQKLWGSGLCSWGAHSSQIIK